MNKDVILRSNKQKLLSSPEICMSHTHYVKKNRVGEKRILYLLGLSLFISPEEGSCKLHSSETIFML